MLLIQFLHPGEQPKLLRGRNQGQIQWNRSGKHKRKFLEAQGIYLDSNFKRKRGKIYFWGEFEPPTNFVKLQPNTRNSPTAIHRRILPVSAPRSGAMNTDPYVFDGQFFYTNCLQIFYTKRVREGYKTLRNLKSGDIILFGARFGPRINGRFYIDTVFVVDKKFDYVPNNFTPPNNLNLSPDFINAVIRPLQRSTIRNKTFTFYSGATYSDPVIINKIKLFSFVPCSTPRDHPKGFERPNIVINNYINQSASQGIKKTKVDSTNLPRIWRDIINQVFHRGLYLGVKIY